MSIEMSELQQQINYNYIKISNITLIYIITDT